MIVRLEGAVSKASFKKITWGCVKRSSYACNGISWDEKGAREKTAICH
jgi:hypothetical protein